MSTPQPSSQRVNVIRGRENNFDLPFATPPASVEWIDAPRGLRVETDSDDSRRFKIILLDDVDLQFAGLRYRALFDNETLSGIVIARVVDAPHVVESPSAEKSSQNGGDPAPAETPSETPAKTPESPASVFDAAQNATGGAGNVFYVEVLRDQVEVPHLRREIAPGRTLRIGRASSYLELNLADQFLSRELERACSRNQAEVFIKGSRVYIKSTGTNPVLCAGEDGEMAPVESLHDWNVGEQLLLPGKIALVLREGGL